MEKGAIHYIRHNFFPLRSFKDLADINNQAGNWRDQVANTRIHTTTQKKPCERFKPEALYPLPDLLPDCRDTQPAKVHTDFSVIFDSNRYTVPPWAIGREVTVKADNNTVTVYYKDKTIATHPRSWHKGERVELQEHKESALKHRKKHLASDATAAVISMGEDAKIYVERLMGTQNSLKKSVQRLLALRDEYGASAIIMAMRKAILNNAYGVSYIENILYQEMTPQTRFAKVVLKEQEMNRIRLEEPSLAEYDTYIVKKRKTHE